MGWYYLWHASLLFKATFKQRKYWSTLANLWPCCSRSNTFEWSPHNIFNLTLQRPVHVRFSRNMENGALKDDVFVFFWAMCHSHDCWETRGISSSVHQFRIGKTSLSVYCSHIQSLLYSTSKGESWKVVSGKQGLSASLFNQLSQQVRGWGSTAMNKYLIFLKDASCFVLHNFTVTSLPGTN